MVVISRTMGAVTEVAVEAGLKRGDSRNSRIEATEEVTEVAAAAMVEVAAVAMVEEAAGAKRVLRLEVHSIHQVLINTHKITAIFHPLQRIAMVAAEVNIRKQLDQEESLMMRLIHLM